MDESKVKQTILFPGSESQLNPISKVLSNPLQGLPDNSIYLNTQDLYSSHQERIWVLFLQFPIAKQSLEVFQAYLLK